MEKLEKQIAQAKSQQASINALNVASVQPLLSSEPHFTAGNTRARRKEATDVDDLVGDFGFL